MRILSVDTTSSHGSVALLEEDVLSGLIGLRSSRARHAEDLLPSLHYLLERLSIPLRDVEGYAVAIGPGSFTGLRIGIAAVEGLAFANGRPVVGVSALEATVHRYRHREGILVALIDAYRGEVYGAAYRSDGGGRVTSVVEPVCEPAERFLDRLEKGPELVAGTAAVSYRTLIERRFDGKTAFGEASFFLAESIARLGSAQLQAGRGAARGELQALYIRSSDAERPPSQGFGGPGPPSQSFGGPGPPSQSYGEPKPRRSTKGEAGRKPRRSPKGEGGGRE